MRDRAKTLQDMQQVFTPAAAAQGALQAAEFERLIEDAERTGVILSFAAHLADRSRCLDDHSRLAFEWAQRAVSSTSALDISQGPGVRRRRQQARYRVEGLLAGALTSSCACGPWTYMPSACSAGHVSSIRARERLLAQAAHAPDCLR
jgi:hypothetical protein